MYLSFKKKYEDSDRVIYNLRVEREECECIYYKNTGAITFEPDIMEKYYQKTDSGMSIHLTHIFMFFFKANKNNLYRDQNVIFNCRV